MTIKGTAGNDTLTGTSGNDVFSLDQGGSDTVSGLAGNDQFEFGATFDATDAVNGGDGTDTIKLDGDYSAGLILGATTAVGVERMLFTGGNSYNITSNDATVAAGTVFAVDAAHVHSGDTVTFDGNAETDGSFLFQAGNGHYTLTGGTGADTFAFKGNYNSNDVIDGGSGNDVLTLDGDYTNLVIRGGMQANIQAVQLEAGHDYNVRLLDDALPAGQTFHLEGNKLGASDVLTFSAPASLNANLDISGGDGNDVLTGLSNGVDMLSGGDGNDTLTGEYTDILYGGAGDDHFDLTRVAKNSNTGGADTVHGGSGDDYIDMGATLDAGDSIDGGSGNNTLRVAYAFNAQFFLPNNLLHIQTLDVDGTGEVHENDGNLAAGATMTVNLLSSAASFVGSAETDGHFILNFIDSSNMTGGALSDTFVFNNVSLSGETFCGANMDFSNDIIEFRAVTGINHAVTTGTLDAGANFDTELAADVGASQLSANHAVLFTPDSGNFAHLTFLLVDGNGVAGWQAGQDLVLGVYNATHMSLISTANFEALG